MNVGDLKELVQRTLSPLSVPVRRRRYSGKETTYFTWFIIIDSDAAYGDGDPLAGDAHIQLDGWSIDDRDDLWDEAKGLMQNAGFRYELGRDLYEDDTEIYHRLMQFYYTKED